MNSISELTGAILQIAIFALIPFLVYRLQKKSTEGFLDYIGLKKSTKKANLLAAVSCLILVIPILILLFVNEDFKEIMLDPHSVSGKFKEIGFGVNSIFILLLIAVFKTAFAEEIFFRGFIAKRLISKMGFQKGNMLQAIIFGILHMALFASITHNAFLLTVLFIIPAIAAYVMVYLNEKVANGSIIPGWIAHGLGNILSYGIVGFLI